MRGLPWQSRLAFVGAVVFLCAPSAEGCSGDDGDDLPPRSGVTTTTVSTSTNTGAGASAPGGLCACVQAIFDGVADTPCDQCYIKVKDPGKACQSAFEACDKTPYCNDTSPRSVPKCLIDCAGNAACEWQCLTWDGFGDGGGGNGSGGFFDNGDPVGSPESIAKLKAYLACACDACPVCVPDKPRSCTSSGEGGAGGAGGAGGGG